MNRRRALAALAAVAALGCVAMTGCGGGSPPTRTVVLRMASADPRGIGHDPAVAFFVQQVARLSHGRLRIALDERWGADGTPHEAELLRAVARGADLGWAHTRAFGEIGVRSFDALDAPMLVDRASVEAALIRSGLARRMLRGARSVGLEPLALLAGPLAHPVGTIAPLRAVRDFAGRAFGVRPSPVAELAVRALRARPLAMTYDNIDLLYVNVVHEPRPPAAFEDDLDSVFFDRVRGACGPPKCDPLRPWVTTNVTLWPRAAVIVANPRRLRRLTTRQRAWISAAAAAAVRYSTTVASQDRQLAPELCAAGIRFTTASPAAVASLRRAWRPVYSRLEGSPATRSMIRYLVGLRADARPSSAAPSCNRPPAANDQARGVRSPLPDGIYRVRVTASDLRRARAASTDQPGTVTLTLRNGRWGIVITEPGRYTEEGTYAGTPLRTAWDQNSFVSIVVDRGGGLSFHVARAEELPGARARYASHRWRRIAG
jgi:TRAP-type C4-dicarboxylate transport system substrate-binding protein